MTQFSLTAFSTREHALAFLRDENAPARLIRHAELVSEVAMEITEAITALGVPTQREITVIGAVLHDVGKIVHPQELTGPGKAHEAAGKQFLSERGFPNSLARFCLTHGLPAHELPKIEDVIVALSDKLWRGSRNEELETLLIDIIARKGQLDRWAFFTSLDECFERIADAGESRLSRQVDCD